MKSENAHSQGVGTMKSKTIHIEVKSLDAALNEAGEVFEKIAQGKDTGQQTSVL
jgi:hypothetical protein